MRMVNRNHTATVRCEFDALARYDAVGVKGFIAPRQRLGDDKAIVQALVNKAAIHPARCQVTAHFSVRITRGIIGTDK